MKLSTIILAAFSVVFASFAVPAHSQIGAPRSPQQKPQHYSLTMAYVPDAPGPAKVSATCVYVLMLSGKHGSDQAPRVFAQVDSSAMESEFATLPAGSVIDFHQLGLLPSGADRPTNEQIDSLAAFCKQHQLTLKQYAVD